MVPFFLVELILRFRALKMRIAMVLTKQTQHFFFGTVRENGTILSVGRRRTSGDEKEEQDLSLFFFGLLSRTRRNKQKKYRSKLYAGKSGSWTLHSANVTSCANYKCGMPAWYLHGNSNFPSAWYKSGKTKERDSWVLLPHSDFFSFLAFGLVQCAAARPTLLPLPSFPSFHVWRLMPKVFWGGETCVVACFLEIFPSGLVFFVKERFFFVAISLICGFISQHFLLSLPWCGRAMANPSIWLRCGHKEKIQKQICFSNI